MLRLTFRGFSKIQPSLIQMKRKADAMAGPLYSTATKLPLNGPEQQVRDLLVDVATFVDAAKPNTEPTVLRIAGGWPRDKVLKKESKDIDVAINNTTGFAFAQSLIEFCDVPENRTRHAISDGELGKLHKVKANPEKSKHLETATIMLYGLDIDFVNLRTEVYKSNSRNPEVGFGTAQEDAERRDATINALFYNMRTGELEDFVGGLKDMEAKVIRTPLEPSKTFHDDPLRVLRLVRFAARLDFTIDPATEKAMADQQMKDRFRTVITAERVGIEVEKMLRGQTSPA
jgi:tRNA nucleotidyltransferase (CCA-adding enzyme)